MKLYFATSAARQKAVTLSARGVKRRLVSFFYVGHPPNTFIPEYVRTGFPEPPGTYSKTRKKRSPKPTSEV